MINLVDTVNSTNTWLSHFKNKNFDSIISLSQSKGFGRRGRVWESDLGGLYYSLILPHRKLLPLVIGVSVAVTLGRKNIDVKLKWPNDILVNGKKLGGIICQSESKDTIVGLGINIENKPNLATSTNLQHLGYHIDKLCFVQELTEEIKYFMKCDDSEIIDKFLSYDFLIGKLVNWDGESGIVESISEEGCLVVKKSNNELIFLTEEVHLK